MKRFTFAAACWGLTLALSIVSTDKVQGAFIIYDDFSSPATGNPDAAKWNLDTAASWSANGGGVTTFDSTGNVYRAIVSDTAVVDTYSDFRFTLGTANTFSPSGVGIGAKMGSSSILLRNDVGVGGYKLDVRSGGNIYTSPTAITIANSDVVTFQWTASSVSILVNNVLQDTDTTLNTIPSVPLQLFMFTYQGSGVPILKVDSVEITQVPEPSSFAMLLFGSVGLWLLRKKRTM